MMRTGHRSIDGVHAYKQSIRQQKLLSDILNRSSQVEPPEKKVKLETTGQENSAACTFTPLAAPPA